MSQEPHALGRLPLLQPEQHLSCFPKVSVNSGLSLGTVCPVVLKLWSECLAGAQSHLQEKARSPEVALIRGGTSRDSEAGGKVLVPGLAC